VRVSEILVKDRAKAASVHAAARALAPADRAGFRKLVATHSEDAGSKARGGDLLFFDRRTAAHPKAVVEAAFALKAVNELSSPIASERGFHILKLEERRPASTRPLSEVKRTIQMRLFQEHRARQMEAWVAELRRGHPVEVFEERLKAAARGPASGP
jgi:parvulin-like peptidyl-prolyl isomerase